MLIWGRRPTKGVRLVGYVVWSLWCRQLKLGQCRLSILCKMARCSLWLSACFITRGRGLTFTSARVLVRAHVGEQSFKPTDAEDHTLCESRALFPMLALLPLYVCHRQETGQSLLTCTCSKIRTFLGRLRVWAHQFHSVKPLTSATLIEQLGDSWPLDVAVVGAWGAACLALPPRGRRLLDI